MTATLIRFIQARRDAAARYETTKNLVYRGLQYKK